MNKKKKIPLDSRGAELSLIISFKCKCVCEEVDCSAIQDIFYSMEPAFTRPKVKKGFLKAYAPSLA